MIEFMHNVVYIFYIVEFTYLICNYISHMINSKRSQENVKVNTIIMVRCAAREKQTIENGMILPMDCNVTNQNSATFDLCPTLFRSMCFQSKSECKYAPIERSGNSVFSSNELVVVWGNETMRHRMNV